MKRIYKERRLYFSQGCERCGRRYQSFKRKRIKQGLCRKCRKVNTDQTSLFDVNVAVDGAIKQAVIECTVSPTGKHEYDPEDKTCMYCGRVQE
jgi:hypothetical protein